MQADRVKLLLTAKHGRLSLLLAEVLLRMHACNQLGLQPVCNAHEMCCKDADKQCSLQHRLCLL